MFFMAMQLHPEEAKKMQAEIDAILGPGQLPTPADRDRLPYTEGFFEEVTRMYCLVPCGLLFLYILFPLPNLCNLTSVGLAHVAREDDVHDGYFIPKGSIVVPNNWYVECYGVLSGSVV